MRPRRSAMNAIMRRLLSGGTQTAANLMAQALSRKARRGIADVFLVGSGLSFSSVDHAHRGGDAHLGVAEADTAAADRGGVAIVQPDRDPEAVATRRDGVGGVEADPVQPRHPSFGPGMAGAPD